jgi:hypothetical protein
MIPDVPCRFAIRPLPEDEGGGYLIEFPDLPGCMSDVGDDRGSDHKWPRRHARLGHGASGRKASDPRAKPTPPRPEPLADLPKALQPTLYS